LHIFGGNQNIAVRLLGFLLTLIVSLGWHQIATADFRVESGPQGSIVIDSGQNRINEASRVPFPDLMRQVEKHIQEKIVTQIPGRRLAGRVILNLTPDNLHIEMHHSPSGVGRTGRGLEPASSFRRIQEIIAAELGRLPLGLVTIKVQFLGTSYGFADGSRDHFAAGLRHYRVRPNLARLIKENASRYMIQPALVQAVICCESNFDPQAVSPKGAQGLMQLMPGTSQVLGVRNPFNVAQNIAGGTAYLRFCLNRFHQDLHLALAAYNAGPGQVDRYGAIPPFQETRLFVRRVLAEYTRLSQGKACLGGSDFETAQVSPKSCLRTISTLRSPQIRLARSISAIIIDICPCSKIKK
jgi:hypothetical protein